MTDPDRRNIKDERGDAEYRCRWCAQPIAYGPDGRWRGTTYPDLNAYCKSSADETHKPSI